MNRYFFPVVLFGFLVGAGLNPVAAQTLGNGDADFEIDKKEASLELAKEASEEALEEARNEASELAKEASEEALDEAREEASELS
ncbi:MAG: hypothetical protein ACE5EK_01380, partial [Nitrospinales bacterium]